MTTEKDMDFDMKDQLIQNVEINRLIYRLHQIRDICRDNQWHASGVYASLAADTLFHMNSLGDKAQRPDIMVSLTDVHYSAYPDEPEDEDEWEMNYEETLVSQ